MLRNGAAVMEQWAQSWSAHDVDRLLGLFTDDCIYEDVPFGVINRGKSELRAYADGMLSAFPDLRVELSGQFATGSSAAVEWVFSGTQRGDLPGMPASHKSFSLRGASIADLDGGKIKRISEYWDLTSLLRQLGFMPSPK